MSYDDVRKELAKEKTVHLLLGNGFSIACDSVFKYPSLYKEAMKSGLGKRIQALFKKLGTNNFEGVMRLLNDTDWVAKEYGLIKDFPSEMLKDKEILKKALIAAVATTHLDDVGDVDDVRKSNALNFIGDYHNVFTTNYDLLLYWVVMHAGKPTFQDGFRNDPDDPTSLVFSARPGGSKAIYYIHGGLHLFHEDGELKKHSWAKTGTKLTQWVRDGLKKDQYPLFVAEGDAEKKLEQIQRSGYLWYCLEKLGRVKGSLVIVGHSLGDADAHIVERIVGNRDFKQIYIGLHGDPEGPNALAIQKAGAEMKERRKKLHKDAPLDIQYFDSNTAKIWD